MKTRIKIVFLLMMPAICLAQQSRRDSLKTALKTARTDSVRFNSLMNLGWEYSETNRDTALYFHDQAFRLAKKNARMLEQAFALWGKGYELTHLGKFPEALVCFQEGLKLAEDPANEKNCWYGQFGLANVTPHATRIAAIANLHHNLGQLMGATGNIDAQITHYRITKALAAGIGLNWLLGEDNATLGNVYLQLNQLDSALMFEQNAERIMTAPGTYRKYLGYVYEDIGQVYLKKQNAALAIKYFRKAISVHLGQKNLSGVTYGYSDLTDYYLTKKQKDSSLYYATRELNVLQFMRSKDVDHAYEQLYESYKLAGKTDSAYKYQGLALKAKDSVFNATTKSLTDFQKLSFNAQIHAQQLEKEKAAIQTRIRTYVLLAGIGVLMLLAGIFYRNNRQKQKANVLLSRQKAEIEAQARESQIEAALEKVRSRSLAMHRSDELQEVVAAVFDKLQELKLPFDAAGIVERVAGSNDTIHWVANEQKTYSGRLFVPYSDVIFLSDMWDAIQNGKDFFAKVYSFEEKNEAWKKLFENSDYKYTPEHRKAFILQSRFYGVSAAIAKHSIITLSSYTGQVLTEPEVDVLKRMARVFEQAYVRFLDLQKAEEQARESQIEAALERVRSRTMGMQKSDELGEVIQVIFEQFVQLNFHIDAAHFALDYRESNDFNVWAGTSGQTYPSKIFVPYFDHPIFNIPFAAKNNGSDHYVTKLTVSEKNQWWDHFFKNTSPLPDFPRLILDRYYNAPGYYNYGVLMKTVSFSISNYEGYAYTETEQAVVMRFGKVFEQTYTRFKDLEQAEEQAREAQIEAALERVRSRTMGMQKSEELAEVIQLIYEQLVGLNFNINNANFIMEFPASRDMNIWMASSIRSYPYMIFVPYFDHPIFNTPLAALASGADHFVTEVTISEKNQWLDYFLNNAFPLPDYPREILDRLYNAPGFYTYGVIFKTVMLAIINFEGYAYTEAEQAVIMRFGKVFEQTYTRFKDLEQAEEQAREAQIQLALERIRARTMAMQKSEELKEVIQVVFEQLVHLGIDIFAAGFTMDYRESDDWHIWAADVSNSFPTLMHIPYFDHPYWNSWNDAKRKGLDSFAYTMDFEEKNSFSAQFGKYLPDLSSEVIDFVYNSPGYTVSNVMLKNVSLYVVKFTTEPYSDADNAVLMRFGKVFEQTYTRFKDLEQAEEQAREAKIEAALEKVRSRSLAMHTSDELAEVVTVVREKLYELDVVKEGSGVTIVTFIQGSKDADHWVANPDLSIKSMCYHVPFIDSPIYSDFFNAKEQGMDFYTRVSTFEEKNHFWEIAFEQSDFKYLPADLKSYFLAMEHFDASVAIEKNSAIFITSFAGKLLAENENEVLKRFARVFDQVYVRFLDLKKAEEQAREAQIEAALEKVRSRSLAMHASEELAGVVTVVREKLHELDVVKEGNSVTLVTCTPGSRDVDHWMANPDQGLQSRRYHVPYFDSPVANDVLDAWEKGMDFFSRVNTFEEKNHFWQLAFERSDFKYIPDELKRARLASAHWDLCVAIEKNSAIIISIYSGILLSEKDNEVLKRFARVFEQSYIRFLDLQKAEAQAREAQIEASLERVRGKAMAMRNSGDLLAAAGTVFTELQHLGISQIRSGIGLIAKDFHKAKVYSATSSHSTVDLSLMGEVTLYGHPVFEHQYRSWLKQENYFVALEGKELASYYKILSAGLNADLGVTVKKNQKQYGHWFMFSEGFLYAWSDKEYTDAEMKVLERFKNVMELTIRRYIELQKSETQAREAIRQASLDRVRAEIASMRTVSDLDRITPLIWNELTILGVPFIRCGVFIMDEPRQLIHTYLSTPDGKAIAAFQLQFSADTGNGVNGAALRGWREKQMVAIHWTEEEFRNFSHSLVEQGEIASEEGYLTERPPSGLDLHFFPFLQGMLYAGNTEPLSDDDKDLVQSLADAFSTAYARYEDFYSLELAKKEVERTLTDLRTAQTRLIQSEKMASLGELTAGIAHEIQNPLNFVNNFSEVNQEMIDELEEELNAGNIEEALAIAADIKQNEQKINHHGKRADGIVKGMLQHSRTAGGEKLPTNINSVAEEYMRLSYHGRRAKDKGFNAEMVMNFDPDLPRIPAVGQDIGRVMLNLFNNAFYAVNQKKKTAGAGYKPEVSVITSAEDGQVVIKVKDNGVGMPEQVKEKIMQPFFTTKPTGEGTGLGLSLTYDMVVKGHGGSIQVNSVEGEESEFIITLPIS